MRTLYFIGGTTGAIINDGDWCWDSDHFYVTEIAKDIEKIKYAVF